LASWLLASIASIGTGHPVRSLSRQPAEQNTGAAEFDHNEVGSVTVIPGSQGHYLTAFGRGEGAEWLIAGIRESFDLDGDSKVAVAGNDIEFAAANPDVPFDDPQALTDQEPTGKIFPQPTDLTIVGSWIG
jgi:hypothetical protein